MNEPTCAWCAGPAERGQGVYLEGRVLCRGCDRVTLHCRCRRPETEFSAPEGVQRAMDGNR